MEYEKILNEINGVEALLIETKTLLGDTHDRVRRLEINRDKLIWKLNEVAPSIAMRRLNAETLPGLDE